MNTPDGKIAQAFPHHFHQLVHFGGRQAYVVLVHGACPIRPGHPSVRLTPRCARGAPSLPGYPTTAPLPFNLIHTLFSPRNPLHKLTTSAP